MKRWIRPLLWAAGVVGVAALAASLLFETERIPVRTAVAERGRVEQTITNSRAGTVRSRRRAVLSPEFGGRVVELPYREGQRAPKGAVVLRMDDALPRARLSLAEDELATALARERQACLTAERSGRELERTGRLAEEGIVSTDLLDQVESGAQAAQAACEASGSAVKTARSAVDVTRVELDKSVLRAPFDGIVAELGIELGEWTTPSPPGLPIPAVVDLIDPTSLYVSAPMDEVDSARIRPGQVARLSVDSHSGQSFAGHVVRVAPYVLDVVEQNRTVEVELELDQPELAGDLLPGTSADAEVILEARDDVLRIPTPSLLQGARVLVVEDDVLVERAVEIGLRNWDFTEIRSGLVAGERVVLSLDRPEVQAGARVEVQEDEVSAGS